MKLSVLPKAIIAAALILGLGACRKSDDEKRWDNYTEWREANESWFHEQLVSGKYTRVTAKWNNEAEVLMRWLNDTTQTSGNLVPLYNSTVTVKYRGWLYDGTPFDSSYSKPDSIVTMSPKGLIDGWVLALEQMHVGDKTEIIIPYTSGYGGTGSNSNVPPYSTLCFEIELRDIPTYEIPSEDDDSDD